MLKRRYKMGVAMMIVGFLGTACSATPMRRSVKEIWHDGTIKSDVAKAFARTNGIMPRYVDVDVFRGVVSLNGRVETTSEKTVAEALARSVDGVVMVENHLAVRETGDPRFLLPAGEGGATPTPLVTKSVVMSRPATAVKTMTPVDRAAYSDLAVGDPFVGKAVEAPAPSPAFAATPKPIPTPRPSASPPPSSPAPQVATHRAAGPTPSDLAVGDPLSGRETVPGLRAPVTPPSTVARTKPATVSPAPAPVVQAAPPVLKPVTPVARAVAPVPVPVGPRRVAVQQTPTIAPTPPKFIEKGILPPSTTVKEVTPTVRAQPATATRVALPPRTSRTVDADLAQEAAEELRRLKGGTE
ncbi:MAG: BON domain-containing protein [Deltaproteobacteria bacterium]|nr:BON domain-containing protein [Deltaproteobacteria bacterium]